LTKITGPLSGKTVAITRPKHQSRDMVKLIESMGGTAFLVPMIEINATEGDTLREFIEAIIVGSFNQLIFLSVNSVKYLFDVAKQNKLQEELLKGINETEVFIIGKRTKKELETYGVKESILAQIQSTEGILEALNRSLTGKRIGIPRSSKGDNEIFRVLTERGAQVTEVIAYESTAPRDLTVIRDFIRDLEAEKIDAVAFTSSSTVTNMFQLAEKVSTSRKLRENLNKAVVVAIGLRTKETASQHGVKVKIVPREPSAEAMVTALIDHLEERP
jgi:uroporphyrinogen-III synthase